MSKAIIFNFSLNNKIYHSMGLALSLAYYLHKTASIRAIVYGSPTVYGGLVLLFKYGQCGDIFAFILTMHKKCVNETFAHQFVSVYYQDNPVTESLPQVSQVLRCSKYTYYLAILTNRQSKVQKCKFKALKLYFYLVIVFLNEYKSL